MYFTSGSSRAFEKLMQSKPGFDHFSSGVPDIYEECSDCRHHRPHWTERFCTYTACPFDESRSTLRKDIEIELDNEGR